MNNVMNFVATLASVHGACWRRIAVAVDAAGKKTPRGERNNLTQQQIAADPGSGDWASISLKHCENLFVVDFDTHALDGCKLHEFCVQLDTVRTETNKGQHHYIYITDIPADIGALLTGSRQQKLCAQSQYEVDLLKGNNVWEPMDRTVSGEMRTVPWSLIAPYFNLPNTDTQPPPKRARDNSGTARPAAASRAPSAQLPDGAVDWLRGNGLPVTNVYNLGDRVCAHVDCDCPFAGRRHRSNNCYIVVQPHNLVLRCHDADCEGRQQVLDWSPPRAEPPPPTDVAEEDASASGPRRRYEELYDAQDPTAMVQYMNQFVCFVDGCKGGKSVFIIEDPEFDESVLKSRQTLLEYYEDEKFTVAVNGARGAVRYEEVDPIKLWLKHPQRRKHREIGFNPRSVGHTRKLFNNWTDFAITAEMAAKWAAENDWETAVKPFVEHILDIWCKGNTDYADYVLNWYAHILQRPWDKTRVSLSVKSRLEGAGKTIVDESVGVVIGEKYYVEISDESQVLGQFTSVLANKLLVVMDEAVWGGDKKSHGKLLSTITGPKQKIECKGVDAIFVDSYINMRQNSNKDHFAYVQDGSRRPFMLEASNKLGSIMTPETTAYFSRLAAVPPEALAHMLYTRDLSGVNIRSFPQTELYRDQVVRSLPPFRAFWYTVFSRGYIAPSKTEGYGDYATDIPAIQWRDDGNPAGQRTFLPLTADKAKVYEGFREEVRGQSHVDTSSVFWQNTKSLFDDTPFYTEERTQDGGVRTRYVTLPPLRTCIERWNAASSVKIE
jgi:hypothetical protein